MNVDDLALQVHGIYISEPSSDGSGESDFNEDYRNNKPAPEFFETASVIVCEPFQHVRRRKKSKVSKGPTFIVPKIVKNKSLKSRNDHSLKNSKIRPKSAIPETRDTAAIVTVDSNLKSKFDLPVCAIVANPELTRSIDIESNVKVITGKCKETCSSDKNFNILSFNGNLYNEFNQDFLENDIGTFVIPDNGWIDGANDISNFYYAPEDLLKIDGGNTSTQDNRNIRRARRRHRAPRNISKTTENTQPSPKSKENLIQTRGRRRNLIKPAVVNNSELQLPTRNNRRTDKPKRMQQEKGTVQNCISNGCRKPIVKSANATQPKMFQECKNIPNRNLQHRSTGSQNLKLQDTQKTKCVTTPQQCNKKESVNRVQNNTSLQTGNGSCESSTASGIQHKHQQPITNHKLNTSTEWFHNEKLPKRRGRRSKPPTYLEYKNILSAEIEKQHVKTNIGRNKDASSSFSVRQQNVDVSELMPSQPNFTSFMKQSRAASNENIAKGHTTKNDCWFENSQRMAILSRKQLLEKKNKLAENTQPSTNLSSELTLNNTDRNYLGPPRSTGVTYSDESKIPSLLEIDPFAENKTFRNKKGRYSIAIQTGCGYKQLHSVETQTDDLETMQYGLPKVPFNFNKFLYEYIHYNNVTQGATE